MQWHQIINIAAAAAGGAAFRAGLLEYQEWKRRRTSIPMDLNPKTGVYEPDFKLRRFEKWAQIFFWGLGGAIIASGIMLGVMVGK